MIRCFARPRRAVRTNTQTSAFTLIELLVVIAIIAVLIAVLLPALSTARAEGHKVKCIANMRSIGQSFDTYSIEDPGGYTTPIHPRAEINWIYDGEYEYGGRTGVGVYAHPDFVADNRILNKYVFRTARNTWFEWYQCPTDVNVPAAPINFDPYFLDPQWAGRNVWQITGTSYRLNNHIDFLGMTPYTNYFYGPYMRVRTRVPSSGETVLLEEAVAEVAKWNDTTYTTPGWHRKNNRFNVLFVDGHADTIFLQGQTDNSAQYPGYWVVRGESWRMDCWPDKPVYDRP